MKISEIEQLARQDPLEFIKRMQTEGIESYCQHFSAGSSISVEDISEPSPSAEPVTLHYVVEAGPRSEPSFYFQGTCSVCGNTINVNFPVKIE